MKKLVKLLLSSMMACSMFILPVAANTVNINDGLQGYYNFDNDSGTTALNLVENGSANDGVLQGSKISFKDSDMGKALHFENDANSYMEISELINTSTNSFSISLWYRYDESIGGNRGNKNTVLLQQNGNGRSLLSIKGDNHYTSYINATDVNSDETVDVNTWQHVIFTYNHESKQLSFYVNGEGGTSKNAGTNVVNATTSLYVGRHKNSGTDPLSFKGDIDELRIYNKVVSCDEAKAIYEDKAALLQKESLENKVSEAQELYASHLVVSTNEKAIALQSAIDSANDLLATNAYTLAQMNEVITLLDEAMNAYRNAVGYILTINTENELRSITDSVFGINHRYGFNGYGSYDEVNKEMKPEFVSLYQEAGFGSIRYPGGTISNLFRWKESIGDERVNQIHGFYNNANQHGIAPNFGLDEVGSFADEMNSELVYVYGMGKGSAKDAADLIEYLNAEVGTNPNGGIDWASVRAQNGHEEPYNVRYFEIGNEMQQAYAGGDGNTSQGYWITAVNGKGSEDAYIDGGTAVFNQQYAVVEGDWNVSESYSDGSANQVFYMRYANIDDEDDEDFIAFIDGSVSVYVGSEQWNIVEDLKTAQASDKVCQLNKRNGGILFGDGVHGAIPTSGQQIKVSYSVERDGFVAISRAMKETQAAINAVSDNDIDVQIYSSYETNGFVTKMHNSGNDELYDGLTIHPYSGTPTGGTGSEASELTFYHDALKKADQKEQTVKDYVTLMRQYDETKVPVISEYGIFRSTDPLVRSHTHAMYIAKSIMAYIKLDSPYVQKHCLIDWYSSGADSLGPTQQAVIQAVAQEGANNTYGTGEYKFFSTPSARVFEMYNKNFGTSIVEASFNSNPEVVSGLEAFDVLVSYDDDNLYIAITNADSENEYSFVVANDTDIKGKAMEIWTLAADSIDAQNTLEDPNNVDIERSTGFVNGAQSFTLKPHSFNIIRVSLSDEVDFTALNNAIAEGNTYREDEYLASTYDALKQALQEANAVKEDATQEEVNALTNAIYEAISKLDKPGDVSAILALIEEIEALDSKIYDKTSYAALMSVVKEVKAASSKEDITKSEVDALYAQLEAAYEALEMRLLDENTLINTEANKTSVSISSFSSECNSSMEGTGLGTAQATLDYNTSTYWHSNYHTSNGQKHYVVYDLGKAYYLSDIKLLPRQNGTNGDIFELNLYISEDETVDQNDFVEKFAFETAGKTLANRDMQRAVILNEAYGRYVKIEVTASGGDQLNQYCSLAEIRFYGTEEKPAAPTVDKDKLIASIEHAETIDTSKYTEESVAAFTSALTAAIAVNENENATQEEVDVAYTALETAKEALKEKPADPKPVMDFYDVQDKTAWFYVSVEKAFTKGLMLATGKAPVDGKPWFEPDTNISRAMVATVLYRMAGQPKVEFKATFSDVTNASLWYSTAITWAAQNNVVSGYKDGRFGCDDNITRQDLAIMLRNYAKSAGLDTNVTVDFAAFKDGKQVVDYAASAVAWCVEAKLMSGSVKADGTYLMPTANATRAECAKMFSLLDDAIKANVK